MKNNKTFYTISNFVFESKEDAEAQILKWTQEGTLSSKAKLFEVKKIFYINNSISFIERR